MPAAQARRGRGPFLFRPAWSGLGDNLQWSHIPRIAKAAGYLDVYLDVSVSGKASRELIWQTNPFVDGIYDPADGHHPPAKYIPPLWYAYPHRRPPEAESVIYTTDWFMLAAGLDDGLRGHMPELYIKPTLLPEFVGKTVLDLNGHSYHALVGFTDAAAVRRAVRAAIAGYIHNTHIDFQIWCSGYDHNCVPGAGQKVVCGLRRLVDIIYSCGRYINIHSGTHFIAAALGARYETLTLPAQIWHGEALKAGAGKIIVI
jgi:hypothetical protein